MTEYLQEIEAKDYRKAQESKEAPESEVIYMNICRLTGGEEEPRKIEGYCTWQDTEIVQEISHTEKGRRDGTS